MVKVRYESLKAFLFTSFEVGVRHLKVAFCDGKQKTLTEMARNRIIYRASERNDDMYEELKLKERVHHALYGSTEIFGYLPLASLPFHTPTTAVEYALLMTPFITLAVDKARNKPLYIKGGPDFKTHMEEGGNHKSFFNKSRRINPFDQRAKNDPFYQKASWLKNPTK
ncbi:hypothetical protein NEPTK9_000802 [Candidatus Neptunochlamydia vexilliferae]|uniref:Uncharacterized protein n=1 Tax=Candidatus Neptunichlamydia vexilliferae TaxID=1651774 RepID=A0ABS0AYT1_9BACT|nr:hypothetical protein [Candidatus Neptunochlamydia vexilliferae]